MTQTLHESGLLEEFISKSYVLLKTTMKHILEAFLLRQININIGGTIKTDAPPTTDSQPRTPPRAVWLMIGTTRVHINELYANTRMLFEVRVRELLPI